jgi:acetolactate synthase-1/2/3 large subunit
VSRRSGPLSVAETLGRAIAATGAPVAFGHPGGEVALLIEALRSAGVPFLLTRHENTAAFMAGGMGELTGRPGICVATLGPGATNMVTGVASALLERAPIVALTGALARSAPTGTTHQALDLNGLYQAVSKRSIEVTPENAATSIAEAIFLSQEPRPGPVHLSIPSDIAAQEVPSRHARPQQPTAMSTSAPSNIPPARRLLKSSRRPAIVVGLGAVHGQASSAVRVLAESLNAPVVTTPKAKGVFPEDHPLFAGVLEMAGDDLVVDFLQLADALLLVGLDAVEFDKPWRLKAPTIVLDALPNSDSYYPAAVEVVGDLSVALAGLASEPTAALWNEKDLADHRATVTSYVRNDYAGLHPRDVVDEVRSGMDRSAIATSDVGAHKMLVGQAWTTYEPRTFFVANGLSSMGYSIPVAAAARLLHRDRPVVAFVGDGGLGMYLGELETLVRAKIDILIVVFADGSLELIRRAQLRKGVSTSGISFDNPNFAKLGEAMGFLAHEVSTRTELRRVLPKLIAGRGVRLLAVRIDGDAYRF